MKTKEEILSEKFNYHGSKGISTRKTHLAVLDAMEEYANQVKPEWVSVDANTPSDDLEVFVKYMAEHVDIAYIKNGIWYDRDGDRCYPFKWMYIPPEK